MKRIIEGKAYNTETAQTIARGSSTYERRGKTWLSETTLYRTKGGAFFTVHIDHPEGDDEARPSVTFNPISYDEAYKFARGDGFTREVELLAEGIFPSAT